MGRESRLSSLTKESWIPWSLGCPLSEGLSPLGLRKWPEGGESKRKVLGLGQPKEGCPK
jgi:hypothetical protein